MGVLLVFGKYYYKQVIKYIYTLVTINPNPKINNVYNSFLGPQQKAHNKLQRNENARGLYYIIAHMHMQRGSKGRMSYLNIINNNTSFTTIICRVQIRLTVSYMLCIWVCSNHSTVTFRVASLSRRLRYPVGVERGHFGEIFEHFGDFLLHRSHNVSAIIIMS